MLRALRGSCARLVPSARAPTPLSSAAVPQSHTLGSLFVQQVRTIKPWRWRHDVTLRLGKPNRPHASKGIGVWWQRLLPALAAERCKHIGGQTVRDTKRNQQRRQQSLWDAAKLREGQRRGRIYNLLKLDAQKDRIVNVYHKYADMLREHPDGFTPSPGHNQQKREARARLAEARAQAPAAVESAPADGGAAPAS